MSLACSSDQQTHAAACERSCLWWTSDGRISCASLVWDALYVAAAQHHECHKAGLHVNSGKRFTVCGQTRPPPLKPPSICPPTTKAHEPAACTHAGDRFDFGHRGLRPSMGGRCTQPCVRARHHWNHCVRLGVHTGADVMLLI